MKGECGCENVGKTDVSLLDFAERRTNERRICVCVCVDLRERERREEDTKQKPMHTDQTHTPQQGQHPCQAARVHICPPLACVCVRVPPLSFLIWSSFPLPISNRIPLLPSTVDLFCNAMHARTTKGERKRERDAAILPIIHAHPDTVLLHVIHDSN